MTIGSCGPTGPRLFSGSSARAGLPAAKTIVVRAAAAVNSFSWVRGVIIGLLLTFDARANESRAALQTFLLQCSDRTMLQCKTKGRVAGCRRIFPKERFDSDDDGGGERCVRSAHN